MSCRGACLARQRRTGIAHPAIACIVWFFGAMVLGIEVFKVEPRRSNLWIVGLIYVAPVVVFLLGRELVLRIKDGARSPGRHRSDR